MTDNLFYQAELQRMRRSIALFRPRLSPKTEEFIMDAYDDRHKIGWDWRESDGCTGVSERYWVSRYFPPCVAHDYACERANRAKTRKEADKIRAEGDKYFFKANLAYGLPWVVCVVRHIGVRSYWNFIGRWEIPE